jgi:hypothetical protein
MVNVAISGLISNQLLSFLSLRERTRNVGIIGKEGMTGLMVVMGNGRSAYNTFVQVAGSALVLSAKNLRSAMKKVRACETNCCTTCKSL